MSCVETSIRRERVAQSGEDRRVSSSTVRNDHGDRLLPVREHRLGEVANERRLGEVGRDGRGGTRREDRGEVRLRRDRSLSGERTRWQELVDCGGRRRQLKFKRRELRFETYLNLPHRVQQTCCRLLEGLRVHSRPQNLHRGED